MCYKPHLAMLIPIALGASRRWQSFGAACVTVLTMAGVSAALFGPEPWRAYLTVLPDASALYESGRIRLSAFVTPYGAARLLGADAGSARLFQAAVSILVAWLVGWIWRRDPGRAVRSAALAAGSLLCVPLALVYDLLVLGVGLAWLLRAGWRTGFLRGEKVALLCCFCIPLVCRQFGEATHLALGPLGPATVLVMCVIRTARTRAFHRGPSE
jgi:hypothetical protein